MTPSGPDLNRTPTLASVARLTLRLRDWTGMNRLVRTDDDGRANRVTNTPEPPAEGRRNLLVAVALIAIGAVLRFLTLYSLDALLAVFGLGRPQAFPSLGWFVGDLAHTLANATSTGMLLVGLLLVAWHFRRVGQRKPA